MDRKIIAITFASILASSLIEPVLNEHCERGSAECSADPSENKYTKAANQPTDYEEMVRKSLESYVPCAQSTNCSCDMETLENDLRPFKETGITKAMFDSVKDKGTVYQIISNKLYRQKDCHFPARCSGIEHFLLKKIDKLPNMEMVINTRDWPQLNKKWGHPLAPIFSFSKTADYWDIMYPAWSFWEGGPAISLYPTGLGKWKEMRKELIQAAKKWPWSAKKSVAFFRGSRTSDERDSLILLSRQHPELVDAQYTKNQAWKSDADTLHAPPAPEVAPADHCRHKYLFDYRGVAASFRLRHLFLCGSLVFRVGDEWLEYFYPALRPWVHYVPVSARATQEELKALVEYFARRDALAGEIAARGERHVRANLRMRDVECYWRKLLESYAALLKYEVRQDSALIEIRR